MIRAVLDTNVVVSALLTPAGPLAYLLDLAVHRRFRCYLTEEILEEYEEVLGRIAFEFHPSVVRRTLATLRRSATLVKPQKKLHVCSDPADNRFLECALEARADYVVTGNVRHFPVQFQDVRVILPRQFLTYLEAELH